MFKRSLAAASVLLLTACSSSSAQQARTQSPAEVVAVVGSTSITLAEVDVRALQQPAANFGAVKLAQALYEARRDAVESLINDALLKQDAAARKLDAAKIVEQDIMSKVVPPTDEDAAVFFRENRPRLGNATLDEARERIKAYLVQQRTLSARQLYLDGLREKTVVRITLEPPRQVVATEGRPSKGPDNAPITMIEFSDFQCPFCLSAFPTVQNVLQTYGDRIHFVYRHYPLVNHPRARPAAEAAACANEQGKFWVFHDRLFSNQQLLEDADLKAHAAQLGMDAAQFNACYDAKKYAADIDADIRAGDEAGVSGTPAFYINGRMISGAQPFEVFKQIIDEELAAKK